MNADKMDGFGVSVHARLRLQKVAVCHPAANLLDPPAGAPGVETIAALIRHPGFTLEHIVSRGAASPDGFWYDQDRSEWVLLLRGVAELRFDSGETVSLATGDPLLIPAHRRHRVDHCSPDAIWLALHYQNPDEHSASRQSPAPAEPPLGAEET